MAVLPKVRSALCAASQLPGEGPTDVENAPAPALYQNLMMMMMMMMMSGKTVHFALNEFGSF